MSEFLKKLRLKAGLTMQELADLAGTTAPQINKLEKGQRDLDKKWALRLTPYLGVTAEELMFPEKKRYQQTENTYAALHDAPVYGISGRKRGSYQIADENIIAMRPRYPVTMGQNGFYATVTGTEMIPVFEAGQIVAVNPDYPLIKGKPCLIETINNESLIRRYLKATSRHLVYEQFNPPQEITLSLQEIVRVSRVVGQEY